MIQLASPFEPGVVSCEPEDMAEVCRAVLSADGVLTRSIGPEDCLAILWTDAAAPLRDVPDAVDPARLVLRARPDSATLAPPRRAVIGPPGR